MRKVIREIFIADDDEEDVDMLSQALKEVNPAVQLHVADNGKDLLLLLANGTTPDIIILDLHMPFKSGTQCLAEIRNHSRFDEVPVILLSNSKRVADVKAKVTDGLNYYITKPWSYNEFLKMIQKICNGNVKDL